MQHGSQSRTKLPDKAETKKEPTPVETRFFSEEVLLPLSSITPFCSLQLLLWLPWLLLQLLLRVLRLLLQLRRQ